MSFYGFRPYVPVAKRRLQALKEVEKLKKKGRLVSPIAIEGLKIARSFWGKAWCDNLERYSDFENRLPRGRTYVRNGSVVDLQIERGKVEALVSGSEMYRVKIDISVAAPARWTAICRDCAGSVGSLVELLRGKLSKNVMERVCREADGLFPAPGEIEMSCSCPDWADMCKHVAATLYGVGARLDSDPDVLFTLRGVNRAELVSTVGADLTLSAGTSERVLVDDDVAALFGLDMAASPPSPEPNDDRSASRPNHPPGKAAAVVSAANPRKPGPPGRKKAAPPEAPVAPGRVKPSRTKTTAVPARAKATHAAGTGKPASGSTRASREFAEKPRLQETRRARPTRIVARGVKARG